MNRKKSIGIMVFFMKIKVLGVGFLKGYLEGFLEGFVDSIFRTMMRYKRHKTYY